VSPLVKDLLLAELARRGYKDSAASPNGSIVLDLDELGELDLGEFLDLMVTRREKISRAIDTLGKDKAQQHFDDVERAIESVKVVIKKLTD
jgi:hypothetical protein